jgi:ribosomal protein S26
MRREIHFNPKRCWPSAEGLFYQCMRCGEVIPSKPAVCTGCRCRNIFIDVDAGRLAAEHEDAIKLFVEEGTELGPRRESRNYRPRLFGNPLSLKGYFWECKRCGDGVPADSSQIRHCRCTNIIFDAQGKMHLEDKGEAAIFGVKGQAGV